MKKGNTVIAFQDGKLCRGIECEVIEVGAHRVKIKIMFDEYETHWFRQRNKTGKFEAIGLNYFILGKEAEKYHWELETNRC